MTVIEFELIERYFTGSGSERDDVVLGVGDDAAILSLPAGHELVVSTDTLVAGIHFFPDVDPCSLGHKALAVNLSDLAAMGARPAWVTLALTLPQVDEVWLAAFSQGFTALAHQHGVQLIGGDTTSGPLSITVQAMGFVEKGRAWRRDAAKPGDAIYVTGALGDAGLALQAIEQKIVFPQEPLARIISRLEKPTPRIAEALALSGVVNAAIDLSDGLLSDLGHILKASRVGAEIQLDALPLSSAFRGCRQDKVAQQLSDECWQSLPLSAGDDYELCFTVGFEKQHEVASTLATHGFMAHCIGRIDNGSGLRCVQKNGEQYLTGQSGYEHFKGSV
ncbi:MAG: thiamine-phosphate kinase [Gammaproteobacteria bacterium]|nr:thiamine-phosphate kinase [Gammaproteobacteria bacterium]